MKNRILTILFLVMSSYCYSQINELGVHVGGSNYIGDVGKEIYIYPNDFSFGLIYKWNVNSRMAMRVSASYIRITDDDANAANAIRKAHGYSFRNAVKEVAVGLDYNYYDYSLTKEGWGSTPYIILELAAFSYNVVKSETTPGKFTTGSNIGVTIPFGLGYKTKIARNIGIGFETKFRYTFKDNLDYNNTAIPALNFGNPDSSDWYVTTGINLVFGFGRKGCYSGDL